MFEVLPLRSLLVEAGLSNLVETPTEDNDEGNWDGLLAVGVLGVELEKGKECWERAAIAHEGGQLVGNGEKSRVCQRMETSPKTIRI